MNPSPETDLYRSFSPLRIPLGGSKSLVVSEAKRAGLLLDTMEASALETCDTFRTLQDHVQDICRQGNLEPELFAPILYQLAQLARSGLLISRNLLVEKGRAAAARAEAPPPVSALGIATRNRPEALERCLESFLANFRDHGRSLRIVVADDSDPARAARNLAALSTLRDRFGARMFYAGREEKERFIRDLAGEGVSPEDAEFALSDPESCAFTPGANRNALLLETSGEMFVGVDDDTVCRTASPPSTTPGLSLSSESDPTEFWFHADRDTLLAAARFEPRDFAGGHEALLGRAVASCAPDPESVDFDRIDSRFVRRLLEGDVRVRVTLSGILGDSGMGSNGGYLLLDGPSRERFVSSEPAYRSAWSSREVMRSVVRPTITNRPYFMTYGAGFDNRDLLPPFMPVLRNEDGIFGLVLRQGWERSCVGHLPWMLFHAPMDARTPRRAGQPGADFNELAVAALASIDPGLVKPDGAPRLRALGRHLTDLASLGPGGFEDALRRLLFLRAEGSVAGMHALLERFGGAPDYWARDLRGSLERTRAAVSADDYPTPRDLQEGRTPAEARERGRRLLGRYGRLLESWPDLVQAARTLKTRGRTLARPI